jgi:hypothetical protein
MTYGEFKARFEHIRRQMGGLRRVSAGSALYELGLKAALDEAFIKAGLRYEQVTRTLAADQARVNLRETLPEVATWKRLQEVTDVSIDGRSLQCQNAMTNLMEMASWHGPDWESRSGQPTEWMRLPPHDILLFPKPSGSTVLKLGGLVIPNQPANDAAVLDIPLEMEHVFVHFVAGLMGANDGVGDLAEAMLARANEELMARTGKSRQDLSSPSGIGRPYRVTF